MAQYDVTYACGCKKTVRLFGKGDSRRSKIKWLETQICFDCQNKAAAEENKEKGLPTLVGTPKQIAWAESIRTKKITEIQEVISYLEERLEFIAAGDWEAMGGGCPETSRIYNILLPR